MTVKRWILVMALSVIMVVTGVNDSFAQQKKEEIMSVHTLLNSVRGVWSGTYKVWLKPGNPTSSSDIRLTVQSIANSHYFLITYYWFWKNKKQEGVFLIGGQDSAVYVTWGDSWHQQPKPMNCTGTYKSETNSFDFTGSYDTGPDTPQWGWRTEFIKKNDKTLIMRAYNITPEGEEALAVEAIMEKGDKFKYDYD